MRIIFITLRALVYACAFIWFFGWLAFQTRRYDAALGIALPAWTNIIGIVVMLLGGALVLLCVAVFIARGRGTPAVFDPPREFVAVGPYKYVRNPMYVGGFLMLLGFGLYHQSGSILVTDVVLLVLFHFFVVLVEEPGLEQRFGQSYLDYKESVGRWLPR